MSSDQDKNVFESVYDKTKHMTAKAGEKTKKAASNAKESVHDLVTGDDRSRTEKTWDEAKHHLNKGAEKAKECSELQAREARAYMAEKTHEAARHIESH